MINLGRLTTLTAILLTIVASVWAQIPSNNLPTGIRRAPLPPGEGGRLIVTAPAEYCNDTAYGLLVRRHTDFAAEYMVDAPAGPAACQWQIDGLPEGRYDALILVRPQGRIIATARGEVVRGSDTLMRLVPLQIEVAGQITINGEPATDVRLKFKHNGNLNWEWDAPLDSRGEYRVKIEGKETDNICAQIERIQPLNSYSKCGYFAPGLQRLDLDLLPGVIRVEVTPFQGSGPGQWASVRVRGPNGSISRSFEPSKGFRGDYFAGGYVTYEVSFTDVDHHTVLALTSVTLTPEQPIVNVILSRPGR
jgi:hypothetical protein